MNNLNETNEFLKDLILLGISDNASFLVNYF